MNRPGDGGHHPTRSHKAERPDFSCTLVLHSIRTANPLLQVASRISACYVNFHTDSKRQYFQNMSCVAQVENTAHHPAGQGTTTAESLHPGPWSQQGLPSWQVALLIQTLARESQGGCAKPCHRYQRQRNCLDKQPRSTHHPKAMRELEMFVAVL